MKNTNTAKILIWAMIILAALFVIAYAAEITSNVSKSQQETIKIGFIGPLTGDVSSIGLNAKMAVEMAVDEVNSKGGINGQKLELIVEDTKCNAKEGANAGNKLINIDGVKAIVGGLCSSETLALAPHAEESKTPVIAYCASSPAITDAGDYIFRDYPSDSYQGEFLADYVYNHEGKSRAAILYCMSDYCYGVRDKFKAKFEQLGGEIVSEQSAEQTAKDFKTQLTKIKESNLDAFISFQYTEAVINSFKQYKELELSAPIYSTEILEDPAIWKSLGNQFDGTKYSIAAPASKEFEDKLTEKLGKKESTLCASQAYDAVKILAQVMEDVGTDTKNIKNALYEVKNFPGSSGPITFDKNGDVEKANFIVKVIKDGKPKVEV